jgi:hypothetical protein
MAIAAGMVEMMLMLGGALGEQAMNTVENAPS